MLGLENLLLFGLVLTVFPFALVQLEVSLNHHYDIEAFALWVFIAGMMAGIPFMITTMQ